MKPAHSHPHPEPPEVLCQARHKLPPQATQLSRDLRAAVKGELEGYKAWMVTLPGTNL